MGADPPVVAVVGPTASGKSAVAFAAALEEPGTELVSVDAFAVYRGLDIGTASPSSSEREAVPHHLVDIVGADEEFDVAAFRREYERVRDDLRRRDAASILVGGTGLYHRVVVDDLDPPGRWPEVRARLEDEAERCGVSSLHARLAHHDPVAAAKMEPTNVRRILRALEVCEGSGRRFSSFGPGLDTYPPTSVVQVGLRWDRAVLADRIADRVTSMIDDGWLDEVRRLHAAGGWSRTAGQAAGYTELSEVLDGRSTIAAAVDEIVRRTQHLAKRQERWFRRDPRIRWVDVDGDPLVAVPEVVTALRGARSMPSGAR